MQMTTPSSFLPWQHLRYQVRPVPLDNAAHFIVDGRDVVHRFHLVPRGAQRAAEHEFDGHWFTILMDGFAITRRASKVPCGLA
jgi:hypothetical protein